MKIICSACAGKGKVFFATHDMKKGEYGWFRPGTCPACQGKGYTAQIDIDESLEEEIKEAVYQWSDEMRSATNGTLNESMSIHAERLTASLLTILAQHIQKE